MNFKSEGFRVCGWVGIIFVIMGWFEKSINNRERGKK